MFGFHRSDLRPAALRGVVVFLVLATVVAVWGRSNAAVGPTLLFFGGQLLCYAVLASVLALVERRGARAGARLTGTAQVGLAAFLLAPILFAQMLIASMVLIQGSITAGITLGLEALVTTVQASPWSAVRSCLVLALPWAVIADARLQRSVPPCVATAGWTALLGSPLLAVAVGPWVGLIGLALVMHATFRAADLLEWLCLRRELRGDLAERAHLSRQELWLLAATDDRAAGLLLGRDAPDTESDLGVWIRRLGNGGIAALQHATAVAARLTRPWAPEHAQAFAALDAWSEAPGPETAEAASFALSALPERPLHPAVISLREGLRAATAAGTWAGETVRSAAVRVADRAAELNDAATVRAAIAGALRDRVLGARPVVGVA